MAAGRGKPVTGCGNAVARYLVDNCEEYTPAEVRGWLKNLDGVMRELREELTCDRVVNNQHVSWPCHVLKHQDDTTLFCIKVDTSCCAKPSGTAMHWCSRAPTVSFDNSANPTGEEQHESSSTEALGRIEAQFTFCSFITRSNQTLGTEEDK